MICVRTLVVHGPCARTARKYHTLTPNPLRPHTTGLALLPPGHLVPDLFLLHSDARGLPSSFAFVNLIAHPHPPRLMEMSSTCLRIATLTDLGVRITSCECLEPSFTPPPILSKALPRFRGLVVTTPTPLHFESNAGF